jgi:SAM-dependent methyltransferase
MMKIDKSQKFDQYYSSLTNRFLFRWVDHGKRSVLARAFGDRAGMKILDLGCGAGAVSNILIPRNKVFGVDHDAVILELAKANGLETAVGAFDAVPFGDGFFDAVVMIDSVEHVPSRDRTFSELKRVLRPDGALVLITPAYDNPLWNLGEWFGLFVSGRKESGHVSPFTEESLRFFLAGDYSDVQIGRLNFTMWLYGVGRLRASKTA